MKGLGQRLANGAALTTRLRRSYDLRAVLGAGLSRPSGLPTFRQDSWFWGLPVEEVATKSAFDRDPIRVWAVYERLRQLARVAQPNLGHVALAALSTIKPQLLVITQNIDGRYSQQQIWLAELTAIDLSQKVGHDKASLVTLHGSLFDIRCSDEACNFTKRNTEEKPTVPGLILNPSDPSDPRVMLPHLNRGNIPRCPKCDSGILRPGVVWFGEKLPQQSLERVDNWLDAGPKIDLVLVIGTERTPSVYDAIERGAELVHFNICNNMEDSNDFVEANWYVSGDVSQTLPHLVGSAFNIRF